MSIRTIHIRPSPKTPHLGEDRVRTFASYLIRLRPSLKWTDPRFLNLAMNTPEFRETQIVPLIKKQDGIEEHADPPATPRRTSAQCFLASALSSWTLIGLLP